VFEALCRCAFLLEKNAKTEVTHVSPPMRDGVSPSSVVLPDGPWLTIGEFLMQRFAGISRETWIARLQSGAVLDFTGKIVDERTPYRAHSRVYYFRELPAEPRIPFEEVVLFQDDLLVVADKPHFLPVIPSGRYVQETLLVRLKRKLGIDTLAPIHRIDRETAGVVVFTIRPETRRAYQDLFLEKTIQNATKQLRPGILCWSFRSRIGVAWWTTRQIS
jgi:tRNA pseudouridine32 synthase / 23S rRNA pseudouridine746 synthase